MLAFLSSLRLPTVITPAASGALLPRPHLNGRPVECRNGFRHLCSTRKPESGMMPTHSYSVQEREGVRADSGRQSKCSKLRRTKVTDKSQQGSGKLQRHSSAIPQRSCKG
jgi:hypothetical protein